MFLVGSLSSYGFDGEFEPTKNQNLHNECVHQHSSSRSHEPDFVRCRGQSRSLGDGDLGTLLYKERSTFLPRGESWL